MQEEFAWAQRRSWPQPLYLQTQIAKVNIFDKYSDASQIGLGVVLMQNGKVVAYASKQLKDYEKNYLIMTWNWQR